MTGTMKAKRVSSHLNPNNRPQHGPLADCWWDEAVRRWRFRLKPDGRDMVDEFVRKYPNPAAILFTLKRPKVAVALASRWLLTHEKAEEARSAGMRGVVRAAVKFEPDRGLQLSTFAPFYILREVQMLDQAVNDSREEYLIRGDHSVNGMNGDGWDELGVKEERYDGVRMVENREQVNRILGSLDDRSRSVLRALYLSGDPMTGIDNVASEFNITKARVRQIRNEAFAEIRRRMGVSFNDTN